MQFTAQQLCGGCTYSVAKLGNWSEDKNMQQLKLAEFLSKKSTNSLKVVQKQLKQEAALAPRQVSTSTDGSIKFGDVIMLKHSGLQGIFSCNGDDKVGKSDGTPAIGVTTSKMSVACTRNVFTIERANENDGFTDDYVHFGQSFYLKADVSVEQDQSFQGWLHSEFVSPLAAAKVSRKQEVCLYSVKNGCTIWQFNWPETKEQMTFDGDKVRINEDVVMRHNATGAYLGSDQIPYENMFGCEFEVHAHSYLSKNKTHNLMSERNGQVTVDQQMRRILQQNCIQVLMQTPPPAAEEEEAAAAPAEEAAPEAEA